MDFTNRGQQFQPNSDNNQRKQEQSSHSSNKKSSKIPHRSKLMKIFQVGLLTCVAVLIAGILLSIATYKENREDAFVDSDKYQAVFLNGGQVYFGKITSLNKDYMSLSNIYYLQVDQRVQPGEENQQNNFTLAKLGCELHRPHDTMVINKDQVIFWENLRNEDGENTVPGAIKQYLASTNGVQNCEEPQQPAADNSEAAPDTSTEDAADDNTPATENAAPANENEN